MFVFRNNTIENLFEEGTTFSGYGDVSFVPSMEKELVWFYQVPVSFEPERQLDEVVGMIDKLRLVISQLSDGCLLRIITLENLFPIEYVESDRRLQEAVEKFNHEASRIAEVNSNVLLINFKNFLSSYNIDSLINWKFYFISQMILSPSLADPFKKWWRRQVEITEGKRKKCIVLDLDNTLWGGVLGEDGISGIKIGNDYPGKAYLFFQEALVELSKQGVILTVCSKNNEADVMEVWKENPFMVLTDKYLSAYQINWENKADNIRRLSEILNIGLDSMVFIDDNPTERELIRQQLPMVTVPEFPKRPYELPKFIKGIVTDFFETITLTNEDKQKTEQYRANAFRTKQRSHFTDLTDFIRSLDIKIEIRKVDKFSLPRVAQMTQKTNQFNLTTHRYTEADIMGMLNSGSEVYTLSVSDRYGDNGITGEMIILNDGKSANIDTLLLSCRILGKKIENAFVLTVLQSLKDSGVEKVSACYIPSPKNYQVADFYERIGFALVKTGKDGIKYYSLDMSCLTEPEQIYTINIENNNGRKDS